MIDSFIDSLKKIELIFLVTNYLVVLVNYTNQQLFLPLYIDYKASTKTWLLECECYILLSQIQFFIYVWFLDIYSDEKYFVQVHGLCIHMAIVNLNYLKLAKQMLKMNSIVNVEPLVKCKS